MAADRFQIDEDSFTHSKTGSSCSRGRVAVLSFISLVVGAAIAGGVTYGVLNNEYQTSLAELQGSTATTARTTTKATTTGKPSISPPVTSEHNFRIDCYPEREGGVDVVTEETCIARGCVYDETHVQETVPKCFVPQKQYGYKVLKRTDTNFGFRVDLERLPGGMFKDNINYITFEVDMRDNSLLHFKFYDPNHRRYEVPIELNTGKNTNRVLEPRYDVEVTNEDPFSFRVVRKSTGTILWDTTDVGGLTFADQFLSISTLLPSHNVYGFGENLHKRFRHDLDRKTWPMFARDMPPGWKNEANLYGVHPFYTCLENDGNSHGVFLLNSNAMDHSFTSAPMLTYRTIGGILDFYMFLGPTPENVVQQYTGLVGRPFMPAYWSLGFQLCRYGYNHLDNLTLAVENTKNAGIPLDVQYADIDHMDERKIFTVDPVNFDGLKEYFKELQSGGMRTIIILDPFLVSNETDYEPYDSGLREDVYIKWPNKFSSEDYYIYNNTNLLGWVWPKGKVVFPDYFLNRAQTWWQNLTEQHRERLPYDGLWIDMNEPANFATNEEKPFNWPEDDVPYWTLKCPLSDLDDPPYRTKAAYVHDDVQSKRKARLSQSTICMVSTQLNGTLRSYDTHSLYGWSQTPPTFRALRNATGERGVVISRSTYPSSGKYAGHWLGDNDSEWEDLHQSIVGLLEFNLFGIPYIGADICGFWSEATPELCKRWMQLGAFYTFSRNHNGEGNKPQDPGAFGMDSDVVTLSRDSIRTRYQMLPYLYTLFHHAHVRGNTVIRPLFHEFPTNNKTWGIDRQFLWGPALLISPILEENTKNLELYLPGGTWYDYYNQTNVSVSGLPAMISIPIEPLTQIPLHVRGGYIIPMQEVANNTFFSRQLPMSLLVALEEGQAQGDLFWDDGVSIDSHESRKYFYGTFESKLQKLTSKVWKNGTTVPSLKNITILGVPEGHAKFVYVNQIRHEQIHYDKAKKVLVVNNLALPLSQQFSVEWRNTLLPTEEQAERLDCMPEVKIEHINEAVHEDKCSQKGCQWKLVENTAVPPCYLPSRYGYNLHKESVLSDRVTEYHLQRNVSATMFGGDIINITMRVEKYGTNLIRIKFYDPNNKRYEVPVEVNPEDAGRDLPKDDIIVTITSRNPFGFQIIRNLTKTVIWDTRNGGLTFADQFLQLVTGLPSENIYGMGENLHLSFRHNTDYQTWPMFARDQAPGWGAYGNLYGVHPFYTCVEDGDGRAHGVLLLNSNAMEYKFQPGPSLTYRTIGGVLDFYMIMEDSPAQVFSTYSALIGRPYLPPYWSLGFQLCRYGYNSLETKQAALNRTIEAKIPVDVLYGDIDHMDERMDFTWDSHNFDGLPQYVEDLHSGGLKYIIILDPALISNVSHYGPYHRGLEQNVYIRWPNGTSPDFNMTNTDNMLGYVWPKGPVVFPDFLKVDTHNFWINEIVQHHKNISFDGLWIDMNEPANFGTNEEKPFNWPDDAKPYWSLKCPTNSSLDSPPYKPTSIFGSRLSDKTLCMLGLQNDSMYNHYDVHSLYGWSQTEPTLRGLRLATSQRGIVISRSTYPGSGKFAGHWLGDNDSKWSNLHHSIIGMLEFNIFGIPYIGADICGFFGDSNPELCQRWMQLGAFYTFSRNHNTLGQKEQDPAAFGKAVAESSRHVMEIRYTLLPYLYTLFYHAHVQGRTVIRSLMEEFVKDATTLDIDRQFLWGSALLISPVLDQGTVHVDAYFPDSRWFDYRTGEELDERKGWTRLDAPLDIIPLHLRGGYIIPTQGHANNTHFSRQEPFGLIVVPDDSGKAKGDIFWDEGDEVDSVKNTTYFYAIFALNATDISMEIVRNTGPDMTGHVLDTLRWFGVGTQPSSITKNGGAHNDFIYFEDTKELRLQNLHLSMNANFTVQMAT